MALVRIYQKLAGTPANGSVFAIEVLQNNIWYSRKVSWEALKGLIAGAESLVLDDGKLVFTTPDGVAHEVLTVEDEVLVGSDNPVSSGAVSSALDGKQDVLSFDQVPTDGSTNPVESNGIYDALALKQDTLTFDSTPTDGSTNPVTSAGIYAAISAVTTGLDWKDSVATYADIATTYPNPQDGWTVTTLDDDRTYRYNGTAWVDLFSLITLATAQKDGLMSSTDFSKLAGIEAQANRTIVSDTLAPSTTTKKLATVSGGGTPKDILGDDADAILRAAFGEHTASGNPVSVDAFLGLEVVSECKVTMNPIQDLHGYSNPWAGGSGKNKLVYPYAQSTVTDHGITFTDSGNGELVLTNTATGTAIFTLSNQSTLANGNYIIRVNTVGSTDSGIRVRVRANSTDTATNYTANTDIPITIENNVLYLVEIHVVEGSSPNGCKLYPLVRLSTDTSTTWTPYSNICSISGRTEVSVKRTGVNQWDEEWELGSLNTTNGSEIANTTQIRAKNYVPIQPSKQYYFKADNPVWVLFFDANKAVISENLPPMGQTANNARKSNNQPFTTPPNCAYIRFYFQTNYGTTYNHDTSVNYPSNITAYYAYNGSPETHTHQYGQTVYGGEDDFVSGEGKSEWGHIASYNGETLPGEWISDRDVYAPDTSPTTGAEVVYKLATAEQITHTPEDITLLKGVNDVSTDGDSLELKYSADIKAYIDSKLIA